MQYEINTINIFDILYYDPVEGAYGVQGRSLERGIKGYFDDSVKPLFNVCAENTNGV